MQEIAADAWPSAHLGQKTTIAWAFFEEKAWSDEVCNAWVEKGVQRYVPLNAMVTDFELAKKIISDKYSDWTYTPLIDRFGDAMLPVIIEMADKPFDRYHAKDVAEALSMFDDAGRRCDGEAPPASVVAAARALVFRGVSALRGVRARVGREHEGARGEDRA